MTQPSESLVRDEPAQATRTPLPGCGQVTNPSRSQSTLIFQMKYLMNNGSLLDSIELVCV